MNKLPKHANTAFQRWFSSLPIEDRKAFARAANTTINSIKVNYMRPLNRPLPFHYEDKHPCRCQPKSKTMLKLQKATNGAMTYEQIREHFYPL